MIFRLILASFLLLYSMGAQAEMLNYPTVVLRTLDKSTARTDTREVNIGETIEFGSLFIKVQSCRKSEPLDKPESASFVQVWEVPINSDKSEWVFSGWMFASSPALSAMDHPIYDVWVLDCKGREENQETTNSVKIGGEVVPLTRESETPDNDGGEVNGSSEEILEETPTLPKENSDELELEGNQTLKDSVESIIERVTTDEIPPEEVNYE